MTQRSVIFVTGGSRGIGRAIVLAAADHGYDVAFTYRSAESEAQKLVAEVESKGAKALALCADGASQADTRHAIQTAAEQFGRLDALVVNAGIVGEPRSILDVDADHLTHVFNTNVLGAFYAIGAAAGVMSTQRGGNGGTILVMSSAAARHGGMANESHYAASKGAVDSMTLALAKELPAHGIRINSLRPGVIRTTLHDIHGGEELIAAVEKGIPLGRAGSTDEVADVVLYLLGPRSSYIHGAVVDVSGGR